MSKIPYLSEIKVTSNLRQLPYENIKNEKFLFSFFFVADFKTF